MHSVATPGVMCLIAARGIFPQITEKKYVCIPETEVAHRLPQPKLFSLSENYLNSKGARTDTVPKETRLIRLLTSSVHLLRFSAELCEKVHAATEQTQSNKEQSTPTKSHGDVERVLES